MVEWATPFDGNDLVEFAGNAPFTLTAAAVRSSKATSCFEDAV